MILPPLCRSTILRPGPSSLNTPLPSTHHPNLVLTPICGNKTPRSLYLCESLAVGAGSTNTSAVWSHFKVHTSKEKSYADKAWCDYCHKPFAREYSTLFRHIEFLTAKKSQLEQYFTSQIPPLTKMSRIKP